MPKYVVEATVCDTIRSVPVEKKQANKLKSAAKRRVPGAKVKVKRA